MEHLSSSELGAYITRTTTDYDEGGLLTLDLSEKGLYKVPDAVTELHDLQVLWLSGNNLTDLPAKFSNMNNLLALDVSNNKLAEVPTSILQLPNLKALCLDDNMLTTLPAQICKMKSLDFLSVTDNELTEVPTSIRKLQYLSKLYLDNNKLTMLPTEIGDMKELTDLHVRCNPFTDVAMRSLAKIKEKKKEEIGIDILVPEEKEAIYYSEIDKNRSISDQCWVVSLVQLADRPNNEHAFLVLEGKTDKTSQIYFADFVATNPYDILSPGLKNGKVRLQHYESKGVADPTERKLLFRCHSKMMDVRVGDLLISKSWSIAAKTSAKKLIKMIKNHQEDPPKFNVLGHHNVSAMVLAKLSSRPTGHNSFTFAQMMLRELNDAVIELPENNLKQWRDSAHSRQLLIDRRLPSRWDKLYLFLAVVAAIVAFLLKVYLRK